MLLFDELLQFYLPQPAKLDLKFEINTKVISKTAAVFGTR
jgi:hypothetical protein